MTLLGIVTEVRLVQPAKALPNIWVTLPGMMSSVKGQSANAQEPISVTLSGMVTSMREKQPSKAKDAMAVTVSGMA